MEPESTRLDAIERQLATLDDRIARLEQTASQDDAAAAWRRAYGLDQEPSPAAPPPSPATAAAPSGVVPTTSSPDSGGLEPAPAPSGAWEPDAWNTPIPRVSFSFRDLEERFAGRALAWVGGIALVAAAVFFLSLAFSRGWITEPMRVVVGLAAGVAALAAGTVFLARANGLLGNVLSGVGLGIVTVALFAATRLYDIVPPEVGLLGALAAAVAAAVIAIRFDARSVAAYGLVAALIAPPVVGAEPNLLTLLFMATTLVGTTAISLFRSWRWLPQVAFLLAAPQLASWLAGDPVLIQALVALAAFWLINVVAAAGEEVRIRRDDLRPSSATLVLANAAFLLWGLVVVLDGPNEGMRGTAVALSSLAHLLVGGWFLRRQGLEHLFGNLVAGSGVALVAIAAFIQLGAPVVPVAWAAEAAALTWLAARRLHRWSAAAALVLAALAAGHLVIVEYPFWQGGIPVLQPFATPFVHPEGGTLGALLLALVVAGVVVPVRWVRSAFAATGVVLFAYAVLFEATGPLLAALLVVALVAGIVVDDLIRLAPTSARVEAALPRFHAPRLASASVVVPAALAIGLLFSTELPPTRLGTTALTPFLNTSFASLAIVLGGLAAVGALVPIRVIRSGLGGLGLLLLAWGLGFQLDGVSLVGALAVLLPLAVGLDVVIARVAGARIGGAPESRRATESLAAAAGAIAWGAGALLVAVDLAPAWDWGRVAPPPVPFSDERSLAAAFLVGAALLALGILTMPAARRTAWLAAIGSVAWVVPFEVYADGVVILWVALSVVAIAVARRDAAGAAVHAAAGGLLWSGGLFVAFAIVASPSRLWVIDPGYEVVNPMLALWPLTFAAIVAGLWVSPRLPLLAPWRRPIEAVAAVIALYGLSVGIVGIFQGQAGGAIRVEELATQAQVAMSVAWTAIGAIALAAGFARRVPRLRHGGLVLLGVATAKVFLIDLAAMDVAYRAVVLAGLGLLLLVSAWVITRPRGPRAGRSGVAGGAGGVAA